MHFFKQFEKCHLLTSKVNTRLLDIWELDATSFWDLKQRMKGD